MKRFGKWPAVLLAALLLMTAGCGGSDADSGSSAGSTSAADVPAEEDLFTDRDYRTDYEDENSVLITLSGTDAECDSAAVTVSSGMVTITEEGTYVITGTLTDGTIAVDVEDSEKVWLVFEDVSVTSEDFAALYVISADKVFLTLADGTENTLTNGGAFTAIDDNDVDAVIFSKDDLTINGGGSLTVTSPAGLGIVCKDDLKITGGTFEITAGDGHALSAKDSVRIAAGTFVLTGSKDGIQADNDEDEEEGFVYICGGEFTITAEGDGISASAYAAVTDGSLTITAGGGSASASDSDFVDSMQQRMQNYAYGGTSQGTEEDSTSCKGIKAAGQLTICDGTLMIDSADDGLHSNSDVLICGGTLTICSGDDGVHADETLIIEGDVIDIQECYEGLEGMEIYIYDGEISIISSDDGMNAAGGADSSGTDGWRQDDMFGDSASGDYAIVIEGGSICIDAEGDGIDSNGSLTISGGEIYISGPTNSANGALDYASTGTITGGILVATGAAGMAENMSEASQGCVLISTGSQSACTIALSDSGGDMLVEYTVSKSFSSVVISCPEMEAGETYTLSLGDTDAEFTLSSILSTVSLSSGSYGNGNGGGMGSGGRGGF